jgi:hypothetical protein
MNMTEVGWVGERSALSKVAPRPIRVRVIVRRYGKVYGKSHGGVISFNRVNRVSAGPDRATIGPK